MMSARAASVALLAVFADTATAQRVDGARPYEYQQQSENAPAIDLWLDRLDFVFGDRIRPYFASEPRAYVTIVRVTTDGELRVLYPRRPSEQWPLSTGRLANDVVPYRNDPAFNIYESSGMGFVFAIASYDRFDYRYFASGSEWSVARLASSRYGDSFEIVDRFISRTLPSRSEFSLDYMAYRVTGDGHGRSRYASRYRDYDLYNYYGSCLSVFGRRSSYYCQTFNDGYYGERYGERYGGYYGSGYYRDGYLRGRPGSPLAPSTPSSSAKAGLRPRPLVHDPIVATAAPVGAPLERNSAERPASDDARTAAKREHSGRLDWPAAPRSPRNADRSAAGSGSPRLIEREPRSEPVQLPRYEAPPPPRAEPRAEFRAEPRIEHRPEPRPEARIEPRPVERRTAEPAPPPRIDPPSRDQN